MLTPKLRILFQIFGLIQYSEKSKFRFKNLLLSLCQISTLLLYLGYVFYILHRKFRLKQNTVTDKFGIGILLLIVGTYVLKLCWYRTKRTQLKELETELEMLEEACRGIKQTVPQRTDFYNLGLLLLNFYMVVLDLASYWLHGGVTTYGYYSCGIPLYCLDCWFMDFFVNKLHCKFLAINCELREMMGLSKVVPFFTRKYKLQRVQKDGVEIYVRRIQKLSDIHYDLVLTANRACRLFSSPIFYSHQAYFVNAIFVIPYLFTIVGNWHLDTTILRLLRATNFWVIFMYVTFLMVRMWNRTETEANKTATYVHKIRHILAEKEESNAKLLHLKLISARLLNTKLAFSAHEIFPLNWTYFHTVVASYITYMALTFQIK